MASRCRSKSPGVAEFLLWNYHVNSPLLIEQLETLLPLAADWAKEQEQWILSKGVPLSAEEIVDAKAVGVREPERVRLLQVDAIPAPAHPTLKAACQTINFLTASPRGLTFQYGIFVRSDCWRNRHLVAHELAHTAQYERLGGIVPFLKNYIYQCATMGYRQSPMEQEATMLAAHTCEPKPDRAFSPAGAR
jgi:hypothetical protein